jgi:hypothetical protein
LARWSTPGIIAAGKINNEGEYWLINRFYRKLTI